MLNPYPSPISAARGSDGALEVFARGIDGRLQHARQEGPGGAWPAALTPVECALLSNPAVCPRADGFFHVFARGLDGTVWHTGQTEPGGGWTRWTSLGGPMTVSPPAAVRNAAGGLEVFVIGEYASLYHFWQRAPDAKWSTWARLDGTLLGAPAVSPAGTRLEVAARRWDGTLVHVCERDPATGVWEPWRTLGCCVTSAPAVVTAPDGGVEILARGVDGDVVNARRWGPGGAWSTGSLGGACAGAPTVARAADGRLEVFVRGVDGRVHHLTQTGPASDWSKEWAPLDLPTVCDPTAIRDGNGRITVFAQATDGTLLHTTQTTSGGYGPAGRIRGRITPV
jgi:hypothetical protein